MEATEKKEALIGQASDAQIDAWKKEHKDIFAITVEEHIGYFKKPGRTVIALASTKLQTNPLGYMETILENTFIGGSKTLIEDDAYFMSLVPKVEEMVEVKTAELVKL
jgi:hypothetical protein